ncbi:putative B-cell CLL/lymphoma 9-like protein [Scophthalmus maximus]|uniref:Putative B-cell CLL/lymphoma 9-like protein n=1 Tax=Scophthalmus maximus TaxID=52904 RepID=A0A2U9B453_SCOMX|nr:B-cell CLL/lymphoma 9-like protein [Scophthalmus maximus]XP_047191762.1 B-cell CLL/lymphoma 9-like protein [Scophthalmus maximus]XP_047191763.1 B-cell CLL/lymphoma 9-like protein [Scophthalmus maximus]XP_047191764.1 B-cell CLL/lymphoma 9-like protein [Scophthalmus maximus]XP_047191765.1 B-cell CLL/lymphoma 9-like protein [Scophthalmus maximus]AWO98657.1 putative B-cell CLL/lymphoma 9-like protein [Scophthalmus maximus]
MLQDSKLANHGKQVTSDGRSQIPGVNQQAQQQGAAGHLGSKGVIAGSHGVKTNQISPGNPGLKAVSQSVSSVGGMLKTKTKRERSVSIDSGESRNAIPPPLETDAKGEGVMRSKRRCVLEKKQPYSGDEWCSGPDTEEDEDKPHTTTHRERGLAGPIQGLSERLSAGSMSEARGPLMGCGVGPGRKAEPPQSSQQVVYVFTTSLANSAAEAVMKGQTDSILLFHQQNVPRTKLEQGHPSGKLPNISEKVNSNSSPPTGTPKSQSGTPRPASAGVGGPLHPAGTPTSAGHSDSESPHTRSGGASSNNSIMTQRSEGGNTATPAGTGPGSGDGESAGGMPIPVAPVSPSESSSILSAHLQSDIGQRSCPGNSDCLSKEQLEHRERSLQTLRDIERLFLRSGANAGPGDTGGTNNNATNNSSNINNNNNTDRSAILEDSDNGTINSGNCNSSSMLSSALAPMGGMKKYEEPNQSIIPHTQSLGEPSLDSPQMDSHHNLPQHPHHQLSSPGMDMGLILGPDGLTPEQMAWRKLQEEYYQEKRRQQEMQPPTHPQHLRMVTEMGVHGGPMMMRGPPPPYHSKPGDQQWDPGNMMGGGMGGNARMIDMHQAGPRGPRFLGQMQRGPPGGGGFPGSPGGGLSMEGRGPQRPTRPGMFWLDDIGGGGPFHGCYPGGPPQHLQGDPDHLLTREEMFRIMEKRQMQELSRFELDRLAKQQQQDNLGSRMMDNNGGPDFSNLGMVRGPPSNRGDPMDFPGSREIMCSPGMGPQMRDLVDSPHGSNLTMNMNSQMNVQQQQQMMLSQKLRGGPAGGVPLSEMFSPGEIARIRASHNGRGGHKGMIPGPDGPFQFHNQSPFSGGQVEGPYLQQPGPGMFGSDQQGPNQMGGTSRLSHMPMTGGLRGADLGPRHPSDLSINVNPLTSSSVPPPHQLKSPSLNQAPSPLLPSPSAPGLKSPSQISSAGHHPTLPPASGAGTPSSSSMKSPQVMGSSNLGLHSPSASPGRLKSPAMAVGSPGWTSPKAALPSPGGPTSGKVVGNGGSSSTETGQSLPPRSSNSTPISQPSSMNSSMPFTSSPDAPTSQNPLSLIMSQMSKYAMPSSTPLYHDAIKTIATSDDEMLPDRPLLSGVSIGGNMGNLQTSQILVSQGSIGPHSDPQSPIGIVNQGQQHLSHDASGPVLSSPNQMGMPAMNSAMMGGGAPDGMGPCNVSPISQNQMSGFSRMQPPSHGPMHSPIGGMSQNFSQSNEDSLPPQQLHLLSKGHTHQRASHPSDSFASLPMGEGPDLSEVIRPSHTGIPEFDLSRIIPSDKPSSTLQYFPKREQHQHPHQGPPSQQPTPQQLLKQLSSSGPPHSSGPSSNPHLANLQNMMAEQQLPLHPSHVGIRHSMGIHQGGSRGMVSGGGMGPMCPPGHMMGRTGISPQQQFQQQQAMMANSLLHHPSNPYPGMISSQQHPHNLMAQQNIMMMQAKQRGMSIPGDPFGSQGPLMSHQGPMMAPPHPQSGVIGPQSLRQRGMTLDSPIGYGPGGMANMPF